MEFFATSPSGGSYATGAQSAYTSLIMSSADTPRARRKLQLRAAELGYESAQLMVYDMYVNQQIPFIRLAAILFVTEFQLRRAMKEWGITIRSRGGRNNVRTEITETLLEEIKRDGLTAVSQRLGMTRTRLDQLAKEYYANLGKGPSKI